MYCSGRVSYSRTPPVFGILGKDTTHTHADQGSFVYEQLGYRWANDLGNVGPGGYESKGYFAMQKFDIFGPVQPQDPFSRLAMRGAHS